MEQFAGLDVSVEITSVCVVDNSGRVVREAKVPSEPEALIAWFGEQEKPMARIGLEAGPTTPRSFEGRIRELVEGHPVLTAIAVAMLAARAAIMKEFKAIESRLLAQSRGDERVRALMTTPGVGALTALTFVAAIDDSKRFNSSRMVGAHFGLTPKKYQSGETDVTGRISKVGDQGVRPALYEAANVILTRSAKSFALKSWAQGVAKRAGMRKAKVALARKLAVVLHQMLKSGSRFSPSGFPHAATA